MDDRRAAARRLRAALPRLLDRLPAALFALAAVLTAFAAGMAVERTEVWPYRVVADALKTARTLGESSRSEAPVLRFATLVDTPPERAAAERVRFHGAGELADPVLFQGERGQFAELCPVHEGCLAVEYAGAGEAVRAWPYRLDEDALSRALVAERPYEHSPGFAFGEHAYLSGMARYPNGDLLVTLTFEHSHPTWGGVARVGGDGRPIWYRRDYSHHWPAVTADGRALVPGARVGDGPLALPWDGGEFRLECDTGRPLLDSVLVLDDGGRVLEEIPLVDALLDSPFASVLSEAAWAPCDPLHLNFVHEVGEDAAGVPGLAPGDLVVSLRHLSAFGVLDRDTRALKRLVRGTFHRQHAVQHLDGSRFLMFDNGNELRRASRLLTVDLATGEETTVFPNDATPERLRNLFSLIRGHVSVSPYRTRAIATFYGPRVAVEVRLADGALLTEFTSVHDVSRFPQFPDERATRAASYKMFGVYYAGGGG